MDEPIPLIAGRECGECNACCTIPPIDCDELQKPACVTCANYRGQGCSIYDSRPQPCREFHCQWRYQTLLDENWRPDRSGVLVSSRTLGERPDIANAVVLVVFGDHDVILDDGFAIYVATCIDRGVEAILSLPSGPGAMAREARLRPFVGRAVEAIDLAGVRSGLREAYDAIVAMPVR